MMRIAICEDDPIQMRALTELMSRYQAMRPEIGVSADKYESGAALLDKLGTGHRYDVFLLDILMPGLNGIDLARELRLRGEDAALIFLTSSADYALDAFGVYATQYVLKPIKQEKLFEVMDKVATALGGKKDGFFVLSTPERIVKLAFSSIVYVESISRTLCVQLADGQKLSSKTIRVPFETATAALLKDARFLHAHKSFILNMAQVKALTGSSFVMKGGVELPVPRYRYAEAKSRYMDYLAAHDMRPAGGST